MPVTPGKETLKKRKLVKRRLRKPEDLTSSVYQGNASADDVLDREIGMLELRVIFKVSLEV